MTRFARCWPAAGTLAALVGAGPAANAGPYDQLGAKLAAPAMQTVTDRTLGDYLQGLVTITEFQPDNCGASLRITSGSIPVRTNIIALRPVADCSRPKPILVLRLTIDENGSDAVLAAMRPVLGKPCFEEAGAMGTSVFWSDEHRLIGVVADPAPSRAFSAFFLNRENTGSSDPKAEQAVRNDLEADMPASCK